MVLHEDQDEYEFSDHHFNDIEENDHKKKVRRMLEDRLEKKRLKEEFQDDLDELSADFDWDDYTK